jgi:hypothetical protein
MPAVHEKHNLATPTPVSAGQRLFAWFGNGQIVALDMGGRVVWSRHLGIEHAPFKTLWGHGSSPTLYRDLLLLLCDHLYDGLLYMTNEVGVVTCGRCPHGRTGVAAPPWRGVLCVSRGRCSRR